MQKLMGDEVWGGACFSLLTPSVCGQMLPRYEIDANLLANQSDRL